uniref:Uncharacterized protein n=1 Tax=Rhizophora mucronata TaxID=61149 RepID=A0A2P2KXB9_RHIMU
MKKNLQPISHDMFPFSPYYFTWLKND